MEEIRPFESTATLNKSLAKNYVANVFSLMFTALIISGLAAVWFATDEMKTWIISPVTGVLPPLDGLPCFRLWHWFFDGNGITKI